MGRVPGGDPGGDGLGAVLTSSFEVEILRLCCCPRPGRIPPKVESMPRVLLPPSSVKTRAYRIRLSCSVCLLRPPRPEHTPSLRCKVASLFFLFRVSGLFCRQQGCLCERELLLAEGDERGIHIPEAWESLGSVGLAAYAYFHPSMRPCLRLSREGSKDPLRQKSFRT